MRERCVNDRVVNSRTLLLKEAWLSNRVANMLNLRPGEGRLAALLLALSLALGCAIVFADTAANALFLTTWGARSLPYVYLAAAVIIPPTVGCSHGSSSGSRSTRC